MDDQKLLRYSRHILLPEIGIEGQQQLMNSRALIIGLGGLGSPVALYMAASGVGQLTLCDHDTVDLTNLQRQIIHGTSSVGHPKVESAMSRIAEINPGVQCIPVSERVDAAALNELVQDADVVLDCSDNFATRYSVNFACQTHRKPLVSGAAIKFRGLVSTFNPLRGGAPCYNCLFPQDTEAEELRCAVTGVFAPLVGIVGSLQAAESVKLLAGLSGGLQGKLMRINALTMEIRVSEVQRDPACPVCRAVP